MPLPLPALRSFEAAARLGSFKAAAESLHVTPTAVSHQIRKLEDRLGTPLFVRETRAVTLTDAGRDLAQAAGDAFATLARAVESLAEEAATLVVTTTPAFAAGWLAPAIGRFEQDNPDLRVRIEAGTAPLALRKARHVDLAIRYGPVTAATDSLVTEPLFPDPIGAYGAPDLVARQPDPATQALFETRWQQPGMPPATWADWLAAGDKPDAVPSAPQATAFDDEQQTLACGIAGQGLVLAGAVLAARYCRLGLLAPFRPEVTLPGAGYTLVMTPEKAATRKVRRLITWLKRDAGA